MAENKKIILMGIPGVGKTTLINALVEILKTRNIDVSVNSFGTTMFDIAKQNGIQNRDELRKLPILQQQDLQKTAAEKIAQINDDIVIIDTHAFINSPAGYYPGLPEYALNIIKPTNFVSVSAKPEEIYSRRINDTTRNRDKVTLSQIKSELDVHSGMISSCAVITGAPVKFVLNGQGKVDEAVNDIIMVLEV